MRENRPYGSEGGGAELNRLSLPLFRKASIASAKTADATQGGLAGTAPHYFDFRSIGMSFFPDFTVTLGMPDVLGSLNC